MVRRLWQDECGAVVSPELAVIGTVLVVGLIVGLSALKVAISTEIEDLAAAVEAFDFTPTITPSP